MSQALFVCDYNSWYTIAAMNGDSGDGAVKTSPNVQETWYPTPTRLRTWKSITSRFSDVPPGTGPKYGTWEFEYDIWLKGLADSNSTEIMIWTYNNGQSPTGSPAGSFTDADRTYVVYRAAPPNKYITFVSLSGHLPGMSTSSISSTTRFQKNGCQPRRGSTRSAVASNSYQRTANAKRSPSITFP